MSNNLIYKQENRGEKTPPPKKSFDFKLYKKNTVKSLNEIEYFLNNFKHFVRYVKLFKILK